MTVQEMVEAQQIKYKYDTRRPTAFEFCPHIVEHPRIGFDYTDTCGMFSQCPEYIAEAECVRCTRDGNVLFLIYKNSIQIQRFIEGGRSHVISSGQD